MLYFFFLIIFIIFIIFPSVSYFFPYPSYFTPGLSRASDTPVVECARDLIYVLEEERNSRLHRWILHGCYSYSYPYFLLLISDLFVRFTFEFVSFRSIGSLYLCFRRKRCVRWFMPFYTCSSTLRAENFFPLYLFLSLFRSIGFGFFLFMLLGERTRNARYVK